MKLITKDGAITAFSLLSACAAIVLGWAVVRPAWKTPGNRSYESRLGYASRLRESGAAFPVRTTTVEVRNVHETHMGEGLMQSTPVLVPVVPMARVTRVLVDEGDRVEEGQLLAVLDRAKIDLRVEAAEAAVERAEAELERVRIGSPKDMEEERPERDSVRREAAADEAQVKKDLFELYERLHDEGLISRNELLQTQLAMIDSRGRLQELELELGAAERGREESIRVAESALREAELALATRELERTEYEIRATATGIIERVLVQEGEFNQDPGRPAFLLVSGSWFEAHLDQSSVGRVREGEKVEVHLEAFAGEVFAGRVERVLPFVTFNLGGPEASRPIRPLGTGSPEWPATFRVRIELDPEHAVPAVPGLTGFARIESHRDELAVPRAALLSVAASSALVYVVEDDRWEPRQVRLGTPFGDHVEILSGLEEGEAVLVDGHRVLEPGDRIRVLADARGD